MSNRNLIMLSMVAAITVAWAVIQSQIVHSRASRPQPKTFEESFLIQGLELSSIASIQIGTDDTPLKLDRRGTQFVIATKNDYPADTGKINTLLVNLADLRVSELVTDNSENHESLHVTEENAEKLIRFSDRNDALITGIAIGSRHVVEGGTGASQTYVRLLSNPNVYLAERVPNISNSALDYLNKELVTTTVDQIEKVAVSQPDSAYILTATSHDEQTTYNLDSLPEGKQLQESQARSLFSAFTNVSFQDVRQDDEFAQTLNPKGRVICYLKNQVAYTFDILEGEEKSYVRVKAEYLDTTPIVKENRVESDEELEAKEAKLLARDHADSFTKTHSGWLYEIAQWKTNGLVKARDDLLEDIEPVAEATPATDMEPSLSGQE